MGLWLSVLAALAGAVCLAVGSERQSSGVRAVETRLALASKRLGLFALFTSRRWLLGGALMLLGIAFNIYALSTAPLTVVQPIGAVAVVITTLLHSRINRIRLDGRTWAAVGACLVGAAAFVLTAMAATQENHAPTLEQERTTVVIALVCLLVFAAAVPVLLKRPSAFAYILGAGVLYGFVAVGVRLASVHVLRGDSGGLLGIPWATLAVMGSCAGLGVYFVQSAYRYGPPDLVVAGLTVIDPMVGVLIGILVLGELRADLDPLVGVALGAAALVATVGVVQLSRHHPDVIARAGRTDAADLDRNETTGASTT